MGPSGADYRPDDRAAFHDSLHRKTPAGRVSIDSESSASLDLPTPGREVEQVIRQASSIPVAHDGRRDRIERRSLADELIVRGHPERQSFGRRFAPLYAGSGPTSVACSSEVTTQPPTARQASNVMAISNPEGETRSRQGEERSADILKRVSALSVEWRP